MSVETIKLARYNFYADKEGQAQVVQDISNYLDIIPVENETYAEIDGSLKNDYINSKAKNLFNFLKKSEENGGFYIARYKASKNVDTNKVESKECTEQEYWINILQNDASSKSQDMYNTENYETDLMNSYAYDTAMLFIEKFSTNKNYAYDTKATSILNIDSLGIGKWEWNTETCYINGGSSSIRGYGYPIGRSYGWDYQLYATVSFRPILYFK